MKIQFTLDWNPFKTNSELFEVIASIVWNEFHGEALNITYTDNKISFTFKKVVGVIVATLTKRLSAMSVEKSISALHTA